MKIFLLLSFALTAIASTRSTNSSKAHDITTLLNDTITQNFRNMNLDNIPQLIVLMEQPDEDGYERFGDFVLGPFQGHLYYFTGITIYLYQRNTAFASLRHDFHYSRVALLFTSLRIHIRGYLEAPDDPSYPSFGLDVNFENITIYVKADPQHKFSKNEFYTYIDFDGYECNYMHSPRFHEDVTVQHQLETQIKEFSPSLFEFNLQNDEQYRQLLPAMFCHQPEEEIEWRYPSSDMTKTKNYFFISNFTSLDRTLSNITIVGMHNFDSYSIAKNTGSTVSTLAIKDIQGTTNLHYGDQNLTMFPLYFEVDRISITVDQEQQSINVTAHNYMVIDTKMNVSLTEYQSKWVMEGIQLAIASSIMPSMKYYRNRNNLTNPLEEHPIVKISTKLSQQFEGRTIQKLYDTWNITIPESFKAESCIQTGSHIYNISIDAKPTTTLTPYPASIKCSLFKNLQFHFAIPDWRGKISVLNTTHKFNDIKFRMWSTFSVMLVKQNNTNDFEVIFYSIRNSDVGLRMLVPKSYNFTHHEGLKIAQEVQELMISLVKRTVIILAKPLLSLPLDYCTAPVKIFDDFLPFYTDHELPFRVPDGRIANKLFKTNISNVIIPQWTKSPTATVWFNQDRSILSTLVDLELAEAKIWMNVNNKTFDERHLKLTGLVVQNHTDSRVMAVNLKLNLNRCAFYIPEIVSIEMKLKCILEECFNNLTSLVF